MNILQKPVSRGKLWGSAFSWGEAIESHAEHCASGCCRFRVTPEGIWIEGDGSRGAVFRTRLPKGAENHALSQIKKHGLVPSSRAPEYKVAPEYA